MNTAGHATRLTGDWLLIVLVIVAALPEPFFSTKPKPFTEAALLTRVRQALDEGRRRPAGGSAELAGDEGDGELQFRPVTG